MRGPQEQCSRSNAHSNHQNYIFAPKGFYQQETKPVSQQPMKRNTELRPKRQKESPVAAKARLTIGLQTWYYLPIQPGVPRRKKATRFYDTTTTNIKYNRTVDYFGQRDCPLTFSVQASRASSTQSIPPRPFPLESTMHSFSADTSSSYSRSAQATTGCCGAWYCTNGRSRGMGGYLDGEYLNTKSRKV